MTTASQRRCHRQLQFNSFHYDRVRIHRRRGTELYRGQVKSRDDHDRKIGARKQRTDIGIYCDVNRTIKLWNQLPAETLATFPCKSNIFRARVWKVIISVEKSEGL